MEKKIVKTPSKKQEQTSTHGLDSELKKYLKDSKLPRRGTLSERQFNKLVIEAWKSPPLGKIKIGPGATVIRGITASLKKIKRLFKKAIKKGVFKDYES